MKCPSEKELSDYIFNKKENSLIEKHLLHCEKCLDIVSIVSLQNNNNIEIKESNNTNWKQLITIAASLLFLFFLPINFGSNEFETNKQEIVKNNFNDEIKEFNLYADNLEKELNIVWDYSLKHLNVNKENSNIIDYFNGNDNDIFEKFDNI